MTRRANLFAYQVGMAVVLPLNILVAAVVIAVAMVPGLTTMVLAWRALADHSLLLRALGASAVVVPGYLVFGWILALSAAVAGRIFRLPAEGDRFLVYSWKTVRWSIYGFWTGLAHMTIVTRIMPFAAIFWRLMGARVGRRVVVPNPIGIADLALITIGDECIIGSDVVIIGHAGQRGEVLLEPVKIGNRVTLGTQAIILPGVTIDDDATVGPSSVVMPRTKIGRGEIWIGVPARRFLPEGI